jgi:hypothetical protein
MAAGVATLDVTTWATIVGTWALVVGTLAFAYWQLRQSQRLHSSTTLLDLRERFYNPRMKEARKELAGCLTKGLASSEIDNWEVPIYFELMGFLTRTGVLEKRMVWSAFAGWITAYYLGLTQPENHLVRWRTESNDPALFREFEWLARRMIEIDETVAPASHATEAQEYARSILDSEVHIDDHAHPGPALA